MQPEFTQGESNLRLISLQELQKHCKRSDCWVAIEGKVYDLTAFTDRHPGGDDILVENSGTEASMIFHAIGHSEEAKALMKDFCIGILACEPQQQQQQQQQAKKKNLNALPMIICFILAFGIAFYLRIKVFAYSFAQTTPPLPPHFQRTQSNKALHQASK